jgi:hypothetical protein
MASETAGSTLRAFKFAIAFEWLRRHGTSLRLYNPYLPECGHSAYNIPRIPALGPEYYVLFKVIYIHGI